jgi:hypothetical protein
LDFVTVNRCRHVVSFRRCVPLGTIAFAGLARRPSRPATFP